jgi:hypothetical protein
MLLQHMRQEGIKPNTVIYSALIDASSKVGDGQDHSKCVQLQLSNQCMQQGAAVGRKPLIC